MEDSKWRAIDIEIGGDLLSMVGLRKLLWGADIFINGVPVIKAMIAANLIVWVLLWITR